MTDPNQLLDDLLLAVANFERYQYNPELYKNMPRLSLGEAKAQILANFIPKQTVVDAIEATGNQPMPRLGQSGEYIKSTQSFQDGFKEATVNLKRMLGL